ncbi:MAG: hypothetical protein KU29_11805 [Sulfurovum sp. FS06-10]|jgi:regulator of replication initiation timing|nr:MAG: hypothetical protein KU29_11805 [Sulfurovum sp. FS06-10]
MTSLDRLIEKIETILQKQKALEVENERLKERLKTIEKENHKQEKAIQELTIRLEQLLTL